MRAVHPLALLAIRPGDYALPLATSDFVGVPTDDPTSRIEVGLLIVGGGPAGLACAIRFGQLMAERPDRAARLGDVPVVIVEKAKHPGSHLVSGAIVDPSVLQELFPDIAPADIPSYGRIPGHATYVLTRRRAWRIPTPSLMRNRGTRMFSLSQLGRWLAEQAEASGTVILSETAASRLLIENDVVVGVRTGDKGVGTDGQPLSNFGAGEDIVAGVTVLADGTQGHLSSVAIDHFDLASGPQTWELGVKEVWKVPQPLRQVMHTMGWPLRSRAKFREFGGGFVYPMGDDHVTVGLVAGLDYRDSELSVHDLLQELKQHPVVARVLAGGERVEWGAKTIPSGGFNALPKKFEVPGLLLCGDGVGMVNVPTLKGVHYAMEAGRLAAETAFATLTGGVEPTWSEYDEAIRSSFIWSDLQRVRNVRQVFGRGFFVGGALASLMVLSGGRISLGKLKSEPDEAQPLLRTNRSDFYPRPDGKLVFDKLSSVFASGNQTREDQPNHIRVNRQVPLELARMWVQMCPAEVYRIGEPLAGGLVNLEVSPANCVQCGAISAKGGRLTPPEGGSGPEYVRT